MRRHGMLLLAMMALSTIPALAQTGTIFGTVTVDGDTPWTPAWVGVKAAPNAMADPDHAYKADLSGSYATGNLPVGDYYVAAWVDGFATAERLVTVVDGVPLLVSFDLKPTRGINLARHAKTFTIINGAYQIQNGNAYSVDDDRTGQLTGQAWNNGGYSWNSTVPYNTVTPLALGVDLGSAKSVNEILIAWRNNGDWFIPNGYKFQYANGYTSDTPPGISDASWTTWYNREPDPGTAYPGSTKWFGDPALRERFSTATGPASTARYWRVWSDHFNWSGAGYPWVMYSSFEIYSATEVYNPPQPPGTLAGVVTVPSGVDVTTTWVCAKTSPNATADPDYSKHPNADGSYSFTVSPGDYYVDVWADTIASPGDLGPITVAPNGTATADVIVANVLRPANVAFHKRTFNIINDAYTFYDGTGRDVDGERSSPWWGDGGYSANTGVPYNTVTPLAFGIDLGVPLPVNQVFLSWRNNGGDFFIPNGYRVQYALDFVDDTPPTFDDASWKDWYVRPPDATGGNSTKWFGDGFQRFSSILGEAVPARYWRVYADRCTQDNGYPWIMMNEIELYGYSSTLQGIVYEGFGTSQPLYNAVVQLGGFNGPTVITGRDGAYSISGLVPRDTELYADALGCKPSISTISISGSVINQDIHLAADTGDVNLAPNGDFENGTTGWVAGAGHPWYGNVLYPHGSPWGNDVFGNLLPDPNPDMYVVASLPGQGYAGTTAGGIQVGNVNPNAGITSIEIYTDGSQPSWNGTVSSITGTDQLNLTTAPGWNLATWYPGSGGIRVVQGSLQKDYDIVAGSNSPAMVKIRGNLSSDGFSPAGGQTFYMSKLQRHYWYWGWVIPDDQHQIAVRPDYLYNVYFKTKSNASGFTSMYTVCWRDANGVQVGGDLSAASVSSTSWSQVYDKLIRVQPPSNAATLCIEFIGSDGGYNTPTRSGGLLVDDLVVDSIRAPKLSDYKAMPDGSIVSLRAMPVTLSPQTGGTATGDFFYIEQPDRSSGIRVLNSSASPNPTVGVTAIVSGTIETGSGPYGDGVPEGERYIAANHVSTGATDALLSLGTNTRAVFEDSKLSGLLIRTSGIIRELDEDNSPNYQWFSIADGYTRNGAEVRTRVALPAYYGDPSLVDKIAIGDLVSLTGVVSQDDPAHKVILLRSISFAGPKLPTPTNPEHQWIVDFESYNLGNLDGQDGWSIITSRDGTTYTQNGGTATVVASPSPVLGSKSLKLTATHTDSVAALRDSVLAGKLTTEEDLRWMVLKFSIWRTPGNQDLPETFGYPGAYTFPAGNYPSIQTNYPSWFSKDPNGVGGAQWDYSHSTYPTWNGGLPTLAGRFIPVVLYMDFMAAKQWSWYNDQLVDDGIPFAPSVNKFSDVEFYYPATFPFVAGEFGRPAYIDNVSAAWATASDP